MCVRRFLPSALKFLLLATMVSGGVYAQDFPVPPQSKVKKPEQQNATDEKLQAKKPIPLVLEPGDSSLQSEQSKATGLLEAAGDGNKAEQVLAPIEELPAAESVPNIAEPIAESTPTGADVEAVTSGEAAKGGDTGALPDSRTESISGYEYFADPQRPVPAISILGVEVLPGKRKSISWSASESFSGTDVKTPVVVVHGASAGPRLCMTAAIHGDELNGVEIIRRVLNDTNPKDLSGTLIGVPIVNFFGFSRNSRYLPDRRDLNRYFPGIASGSSASRIAHNFFNGVIRHCDALVDFHTGSFDRANLPQVRGDLTIPSVLEFTRGFGATSVLHSPGSRGMLRYAATSYGIPATTFEVGAPMRLEPAQIDMAVQAMQTIMHKMGMTKTFRMWSEPQPIFYDSKWVRSDAGGMLFSSVELGDRVRINQRLGKVIDPIQNTEKEILSPVRGRVIGMALNQIVLPGFAAFHIGVETSEARAVQKAATPIAKDAIELMEQEEFSPPPADLEHEHEEEAGPDEPEFETEEQVERE